MADDFDLDDLLDDVLDESVPIQHDDLLNDVADELLNSTMSQPIKQPLKYPEMSCLPEEMQKKWETTIDADEVIMKSKKSKKLSNAYMGSKGKMKDLSLQKLCSLLLESVLEDRKNGKVVMKRMLQDEKFMMLFKEEMKKKIRLMIEKDDKDLVKGNFPEIKHLIDL